MAITLKVQGAADAQAVFDLFAGSGVTRKTSAGGWNELRLTGYTGSGYSALIHARQCFPHARIFCTTAKSARDFG